MPPCQPSNPRTPPVILNGIIHCGGAGGWTHTCVSPDLLWRQMSALLRGFVWKMALKPHHIYSLMLCSLQYIKKRYWTSMTSDHVGPPDPGYMHITQVWLMVICRLCYIGMLPNDGEKLPCCSLGVRMKTIRHSISQKRIPSRVICWYFKSSLMWARHIRLNSIVGRA